MSHNPTRCDWCGEEISFDGEDWIDQFGEACCEARFEDCAACQDGELHPHEANGA